MPLCDIVCQGRRWHGLLCHATQAYEPMHGLEADADAHADTEFLDPLPTGETSVAHFGET